MDKMQKNDVSCFRQSRTTSIVCWHLYFGIEVTLSTFVMVALAKGKFLTLTTQTVPISNKGSCSVDDLLYSVARP